MTIIFTNGQGKVYDIPEDKFDEVMATSKQTGMEPGFEMRNKEGKRYVIPKSKYDEAVKGGLIHEPIWEAKQASDNKYVRDEMKRLNTPEGESETRLRGYADTFTAGQAGKLQALVRGGSLANVDKNQEEYDLSNQAAEIVNPQHFMLAKTIANAPAMLAPTGGLKNGIQAIIASGADRGLREGTVEGAIEGAAIGAIPLGIEGGLAAKRMIQKGGSELLQKGKVLWSGAREGAKAAESLGTSIPLLDGIPKVAGAIKGAVNASKDADLVAKEIADLRRVPKPFPEGGKVTSIGSGKVLDDVGELAGDDLLGLQSMMGDARTNEYLASKAASAMPGQYEAKEIENILNMPYERRMAAREFDNKKAAKELSPLVDELQQEFNKARGEGYKVLHQKAADEIPSTMESFDGIKKYTESLTRKGEHSIIPPKNQAEIKRAMDVIDNGTANIPGLEHIDGGLGTGALHQVSNSERLARLQRARQMLQEQRDYFTKNEMGTAEKLVANLENQIDGLLKQSPSKVRADNLYSKGSQVEDNLFGATEFRGKDGRTNIDEFKIAKLFNDNDSAGRFGNAIQDAREYIKNPDFNPETAQKMGGLLDQIEGIRSVAQDKRALDALRYKQGPSSPAIDRLGQQLSKDGIAQSAITNPSGFINSRDQFVKTYAERVFGKSFSNLDKSQQAKLIKAHVWQQNNPKASQAETQKVFGKIFEQ